MGTRHLIAVVSNGQYKVANYGQWDGYPEGQGAGILKFLREEMNLQVLKQNADACSWIKEEEYSQLWSNIGVKLNDSGWVTMEDSNKFKQHYLHLHRDCGSDIMALLQASPNGLKLSNNLSFAASSSCEWAYVVDLDNQFLEVYKGYNKEKLTPDDRFFFLMEDAEKENAQYPQIRPSYPAKLLKKYSFNELPEEDDFVSELKRIAYPEDEE